MYHSPLSFLQDYVIYYKRKQLQKRVTATFKQRDGRTAIDQLNLFN